MNLNLNAKSNVNEQTESKINDNIDAKKLENSNKLIFQEFKKAIDPKIISQKQTTTQKKKNEPHFKNQKNNAGFPIIDKINEDTTEIMLNLVKSTKDNSGVACNGQCIIKVTLSKNQDCMKKLMNELRSYDNLYNTVC